jgi:hypothetical protein
MSALIELKKKTNVALKGLSSPDSNPEIVSNGICTVHEKEKKNMRLTEFQKMLHQLRQ